MEEGLRGPGVRWIGEIIRAMEAWVEGLGMPIGETPSRHRASNGVDKGGP